MSRAKQTIEELLAYADVRVNGSRPWDIKVNDERVYKAVLRGGSMAFGESYMAGWWDAERLDETITKILSAGLYDRVRATPANIALFLSSFFGNKGTPSKAFEIGTRHYDTGNDLFEAMLDRSMTYTCGYWKDAKNLDEAEEAKLDLVCRKLGLKKGQTVLDIGSGWGSFAKFAAERYGASVTGITVSAEQKKLAEVRCKGLPVNFLLQDYRDITGMFDHIVSLGMFEHVGYKHYRTYMRVAHDHLKDGGLFLLHSIGGNTSTTHTDPWVTKYIFPNSMLPSVAQIGRSIERFFVMEDWHNFGTDYVKTLMAWFTNFDRHWPELRAKYGDTFYRMWKFYLLSSAGSFRARQIQLWQIVLSKGGVKGGYTSLR